MDSGKIILYRTDDGEAALSLYARDGSVWMNQAQLAELFATSKQSAWHTVPPKQIDRISRKSEISRRHSTKGNSAD